MADMDPDAPTPCARCSILTSMFVKTLAIIIGNSSETALKTHSQRHQGPSLMWLTGLPGWL